MFSRLFTLRFQGFFHTVLFRLSTLCLYDLKMLSIFLLNYLFIYLSGVRSCTDVLKEEGRRSSLVELRHLAQIKIAAQVKNGQQRWVKSKNQIKIQ